MPAANTVLAGAIIDSCNLQLRNVHERQYSRAELLDYLNQCLEMVYQVLVDSESELVRSELESFDTVAGQETYDLAANNMGDLWTVWTVWTDGYTPLEKIKEKDRYDYLLAAAAGYTMPAHYYLEGNMIGLLPIPDKVYTYRVKYFPNFVRLAAETNAMPYKNLFNLQIKEGVIFLAKNREMMNTAVETALMSLFQERAWALSKRREKSFYQVTPRWR